MNAFQDLTKRSENALDPPLDDTPGRATSRPDTVARAKKMQADVDALPDPIIGVYGALRGLVDRASTGIVVHVVAATPDEGASTIAKLIASTAATAGSGRVLLMDGKLPSRAPAGKEYGTSTGNLASRRTAGGESAVDGLFTDSISNVAQNERFNPHDVKDAYAAWGLAYDLVIVGSIADAGRNERVNPQDVKDAYAAWRQEYDLVIVDCPPMSSGRYIDLVPAAADWVILVVQAEKLRPAVLRRVREAIEQQGGKILGVILKDAKRYLPKFIDRLI